MRKTSCKRRWMTHTVASRNASSSALRHLRGFAAAVTKKSTYAHWLMASCTISLVDHQRAADGGRGGLYNHVR